jgi:hypothetical protein
MAVAQGRTATRGRRARLTCLFSTDRWPRSGRLAGVGQAIRLPDGSGELHSPLEIGHSEATRGAETGGRLRFVWPAPDAAWLRLSARYPLGFSPLVWALAGASRRFGELRSPLKTPCKPPIPRRRPPASSGLLVGRRPMGTPLEIGHSHPPVGQGPEGAPTLCGPPRVRERCFAPRAGDEGRGRPLGPCSTENHRSARRVDAEAIPGVYAVADLQRRASLALGQANRLPYLPSARRRPWR